MNIVETVKQFIGPDVVDQIAPIIGAGQSETRSAVNAAVPAMLSGLAGVASGPDGARRLNEVVGRQDDSLLSNVSGTFQGGSGRSLVSQGSSMIESLLGGGMSSGLTGALSKFTGLGGSAISSLLGALAPIVLGVLRKQKNAMGLDSSGLAGMLSGQKKEIAAAMPAGLAGMLANVPGLSNISDWTRTRVGQETNSRAVVGTQEASGRHRTTSRQSVLNWLVPLVLLGLITWIAFSWFSNRRTPTPVPATNPPTAPDNLGYVPPTEPADAVSSELDSVSGEATQSLAAVTDTESAQRAASRIQEINTRLDRLYQRYEQMPAAAQGPIRNLVTSIKTRIQPQVDRVRGMPGVGSVLNQQLDSMMQKLDAFAG